MLACHSHRPWTFEVDAPSSELEVDALFVGASGPVEYDHIVLYSLVFSFVVCLCAVSNTCESYEYIAYVVDTLI